MTSHEQAFGSDSAAAETSLSSLAGSLAKGIAGWVRRCADYWTAAALYDSLRLLSDAELRRRELSRDTLARDAFVSRNWPACG